MFCFFERTFAVLSDGFWFKFPILIDLFGSSHIFSKAQRLRWIFVVSIGLQWVVAASAPNWPQSNSRLGWLVNPSNPWTWRFGKSRIFKKINRSILLQFVTTWEIFLTHRTAITVPSTALFLFARPCRQNHLMPAHLRPKRGKNKQSKPNSSKQHASKPNNSVCINHCRTKVSFFHCRSAPFRQLAIGPNPLVSQWTSLNNF